MSRQRILTTTIAALLSTGVIAAGAGTALAADHMAKAGARGGKPASDETANQDQEWVKVSEDTMLSMRDINDARLALFNGQPEKARTEVDAALARINAAVNEAEAYAVDVKTADRDDWYVPFDTQVTMLDAYTPTGNGSNMNQGMGHMHDGTANAHDGMGRMHGANTNMNDGMANMHGKEDKQDTADDMFSLNEVDVAVSAGLVPVKFAQQRIIEAANLINIGDYYAANMALKAVDDAVIVHTVAIDETPHDDAT